MSILLNTYLESLMDDSKIKKRVNVAGGIIYKFNHEDLPMVLTIQRSKDDHWPLYYEFPRGKCDKGKNEPLIDCAKREIKEETGLDVLPGTFLGKFSYVADKGTKLSTQYNFLCRMVDENQKIILSKEHQDFKWILSAAESELLMLPEMKKIVSRAFEILKPENVHTFYKPKANEKIEESLCC